MPTNSHAQLTLKHTNLTTDHKESNNDQFDIEPTCNALQSQFNGPPLEITFQLN